MSFYESNNFFVKKLKIFLCIYGKLFGHLISRFHI